MFGVDLLDFTPPTENAPEQPVRAANTLQNRKPLTIPLMKRGNESGQDEQLVGIPGGDEGTRTPGLLHAKQALFQLSYIPTCFNYGGLRPDVKHI